MPANANRWNIGSGATLSTQQQADLAAGKLYVLVRTAANPNGELRGQLLPTGITVKFATLSGAAEVPPVVSTASGQIAVTVDATGLRAAANINVTGLSCHGRRTGEWRRGQRWARSSARWLWTPAIPITFSTTPLR